MSLRINLAALTEGELLALYGPQEMQARLPDISRARFDGRPLLAVEMPTHFPTEALPDDPQRIWGMTPEQTQALARTHAQILAVNAVSHGVYAINPPDVYVRGYTLGETAIALQWSEAAPRENKPEVKLLTWLRDRASGLACVLTSNGAMPAPTPSEQIDTHLHPELGVADLLARHNQHVQRLGRPMKLAAENPWVSAWQASHDLNLAAWKRRGVVVEATRG